MAILRGCAIYCVIFKKLKIYFPTGIILCRVMTVVRNILLVSLQWSCTVLLCRVFLFLSISGSTKARSLSNKSVFTRTNLRKPFGFMTLNSFNNLSWVYFHLSTNHCLAHLLAFWEPFFFLLYELLPHQWSRNTDPSRSPCSRHDVLAKLFAQCGCTSVVTIVQYIAQFSIFPSHGTILCKA